MYVLIIRATISHEIDTIDMLTKYSHYNNKHYALSVIVY